MGGPFGDSHAPVYWSRVGFFGLKVGRQIVEFEHSTGDRICQIAVCSITDGQWVLVFHSDLDSSVPAKK